VGFVVGFARFPVLVRGLPFAAIGGLVATVRDPIANVKLVLGIQRFPIAVGRLPSPLRRLLVAFKTLLLVVVKLPIALVEGSIGIGAWITSPREHLFCPLVQ